MLSFRCTICTTCAPVLRITDALGLRTRPFEQLHCSLYWCTRSVLKIWPLSEETATRVHLLIIRLMARMHISSNLHDGPRTWLRCQFNVSCWYVCANNPTFHLHAMFAQLLVDEGVDNGHLYNSGEIQARPTMASSSTVSIATVLYDMVWSVCRFLSALQHRP